MNFIPKLIFGILVVATSTLTFAKSPDAQPEPKQIIQKLFTEDAKALLCRDPSGDENRQLIKMLMNYFSNDFMKYLSEICLKENSVWMDDIRTGQNELFMFPDSKAEFKNLKIEKPLIKANTARVRAIYDLPYGKYKDFGVFSK